MTHTATTQIAATLGRLHLLVTFDPEEIGRRIAAARNKGWTQVNLAHHANVSPSTVSRWERGFVPPVRELIRIAAVLEIDVTELVEEQPRHATDPVVLARLDRIEGMLHELLGKEEDDDEEPRAASA
jgi:transcriptional regulator with XRE-family HTH domain